MRMVMGFGSGRGGGWRLSRGLLPIAGSRVGKVPTRLELSRCCWFGGGESRDEATHILEGEAGLLETGESLEDVDRI
jgi:hypothetical protein